MAPAAAMDVEAELERWQADLRTEVDHAIMRLNEQRTQQLCNNHRAAARYKILLDHLLHSMLADGLKKRLLKCLADAEQKVAVEEEARKRQIERDVIQARKHFAEQKRRDAESRLLLSTVALSSAWPTEPLHAGDAPAGQKRTSSLLMA